MSYREGRFWQPDVTVAAVVVADGRLLMVEESVGGRLVLNQPAGHLEPDETLVDAALRETRASVTEEMLHDYAEIERTLKSDAVRPTGGIGFVLPGMLQPRARPIPDSDEP